MAQIFISYRRDDAGPSAHHLAADLERRFGKRAVFIDVDRIAPGEDFVEAIERTIEGCHATVVVIGPRWLSVRGQDGGRRLDDPSDLVRQEVATALRGRGPVVPILVDGASMPTADTLPGDLEPLLRRNALELSASRRAYDVDRLCRVLEPHIPGATLSRRVRRAAPLAGAALVMGLGIAWLGGGNPFDRTSPPDGEGGSAAESDRQVAIPPNEITPAPPWYSGRFAYQYAGAGVFLTPADSRDPRRSRLLLLENGRRLGPAHQPRQDVYSQGGGRYSHFTTDNGETDLIFSTSDNTDPRQNGRTYAVTDVFTIDPGEIRKGPGTLLFQYFGEGARLTEPDGPKELGRRSKLRLYEDGRPLPQPHAGHDAIGSLGRGRYSHWSDDVGKVYVNFSALNPTEDPRTAGRRYTIRVVD